MKPVCLDGRSLTRAQLVAVAHGASVELDEAALQDVTRAAEFLANKVEHGEPICGCASSVVS